MADVVEGDKANGIPSVTSWSHVETCSTRTSTRITAVDYTNYIVFFVLQGPQDRIASWVEAKRSVGSLSDYVDYNVNVLFGDRDDIWSCVIARRTADLAKKDVLLAISLSKECKCETGAQEISLLVSEFLKSTFTI